MPTLGLLMLHTHFPRPPGDIGHPQTFAFKVCRRVVEGASPERVVRGSDTALLRPFMTAAHELVAQGCDAIGTSCGFLALWQPALQAALPVPVWTSSLLQLPQAQAAGRRCGVITIEAASLSAAHLQAVGAHPATPIEGITPGSPLHRSLLHDLSTLDEVDAQAQVLAAARRLLVREPDIDTVVLECTNLPPYAEALRAQTGLQVLDVVTLLNQRMAAMQPRDTWRGA
ncbi:MAG: aspartate/glutamate racemase family protein [Rubrivivax sp.]